MNFLTKNKFVTISLLVTIVTLLLGWWAFDIPQKHTFYEPGLIITHYSWNFFILFTSIVVLISASVIYFRQHLENRLSNIEWNCKKLKVNRNVLFFILFVLLVPVLQVHTLWDFKGEEVDENAIFHFAVGFLGGDLDPNWYGYGGLGMYLLSFVYLLLFIPQYLVGSYSSLHEYAMQLFYNDWFLLVGRYVFAMAGMVGMLVYAKMLKQLKIPVLLLFAFLFALASSSSAIFFSNNIRTDQLVMMFTALAIFFAANSHDKKNLYFMAIAIAGAIASKISALPLVALLGIYTLYRVYDKTISWKHVFGVGLVLIVFLFVFQPYTDLFKRIVSIIRVGTVGYAANRESVYLVKSVLLSDRLMAIYSHFLRFIPAPVIFSLIFLVFSHQFKQVVIPSLITLLLLILPYTTAYTTKYYWFLPAFCLVMFLSFIGTYSFVSYVYEKLALRYETISRNSTRFSTWTMAGLIFIFIIPGNLLGYHSQYQWKPTNTELAKNYIIDNLIEDKPVVLDAIRSQYMPKIYSPDDYAASKFISRTFMHGRNSNVFLNEVFSDYLDNHYLSLIDKEKVFSVERLNYTKSKIDPRSQLKGKYFVTMPFIYETPLSKSPESRLGQFYAFVTTGKLVARFSEGTGRPVEIYYISDDQ